MIFCSFRAPYSLRSRLQHRAHKFKEIAHFVASEIAKNDTKLGYQSDSFSIRLLKNQFAIFILFILKCLQFH
jgi:hypothetical protein